jgi:hypothetical protein
MIDMTPWIQVQLLFVLWLLPTPSIHPFSAIQPYLVDHPYLPAPLELDPATFSNYNSAGPRYQILVNLRLRFIYHMVHRPDLRM